MGIDYRHLKRLEGWRDTDGIYKTPEYHNLPMCRRLMDTADSPAFLYLTAGRARTEQEMDDIEEMTFRYNEELLDDEDEMDVEEMSGYLWGISESEVNDENPHT